MRLIGLIAALAVASLVTACSGGSSGSSSPTAQDPGLVIDKSFTSTAVVEDGADRPLVPGSSVTVSFTAEGISAQAGCNTLVGNANLEGGTITLDGELASTMMACDQALMDQDQWLSTFLTSGPRWSVDGTTLTLANDSTTITLSEASGA